MNFDIFIRNVLDFYLNHIIGNYNVLKSSLVINICIVVNLFIISLFFIVADYYDLKFGIIPNKLSLGLLVYGFSVNLLFAIIFNNVLIFFYSIALTVFAGTISFILWYIGFWGGGDFKFFIGLSLSLSFLDVIIPDSFINFVLENLVDLNFSVFNQVIIYPKVFSVLFNGIFIAFISLFLILIYGILKNKQLKYYSILSILDFKSMFNQLTTKSISINDLSEGMVLDKYYFDNGEIFGMINRNNDGNQEKYNQKKNFSNLKAFKEEDIFYFTSLKRIGLTEYDVDFINDLFNKGLIKNSDFQIKKGIPFMPFLTLGYIGFLISGDFIYIISSFFKTLF